jgi:predicted deacylase
MAWMDSLGTIDPDDHELVVGGTVVRRGQRVVVDVQVSTLLNHQPVYMPVHVIRGNAAGPRLFVSATLHGDEVNGIEVIRRLLRRRDLKSLQGDLLVVPVIGIPAFLNRSRYLPDRRDLNRLFPGSEDGSIGGRLARVFLREVAYQCTHGIDLHTGAVNRPNLPQVRLSSKDSVLLGMAKAFGSPVAMVQDAPEGSLRAHMHERGMPLLMYEAGEAHRLDAPAVRQGLAGVLGVMRHLGMLRTLPRKKSRPRTVVSSSSFWERAPVGGIFTALVPLGKAVTPETVIGFVGDPFGIGTVNIRPREAGLVIGRTNLAMVDEGEALFHLARMNDPDAAETTVREVQAHVDTGHREPVDHNALDPAF